MNTTTAALVKQAARSMRFDNLEATEENVARWSEWAQVGQVTSMADSTFSRFVKQVAKEVAAMVQEDADMAVIMR